MELKEKGGIQGVLTARILGPDGREIDRVEMENRIVSVGLNHIASRLVGTDQAVMTHMGIGSGTAAPVAGTTSLGAQLHRTTLDSTDRTNNVVTYVATFDAGDGTGTIREAALFNGATGGTMLAMAQVSPNIVKSASMAVEFTWTVTFNDA